MPDSVTAARLRFPILLSILAAVVTIFLKAAAYYLTGSVGLLSDAAESLVNLLAAATAYLSLLYAARPVDPDHTYGHEKIEFFSSGLEGILIVVAAAGIAWYAVSRFFTGGVIESLGLGTAISATAALINLAVARFLLREGRALGSVVLQADGKHLMSDVWTTAAVLAGLGLAALTGIQALDELLGLGVSAWIAWTGIDLIWRSFDGLMDHALPEREQADVRAAIEAQLEPHMAYHALRTRQAGARRFVDFHLLVPGAMSVKDAHDVGERLEDAIRAVLPGSEIVVHIEPIEELGAWEDSELVALEQAARQTPTGRQHPSVELP